MAKKDPFSTRVEIYPGERFGRLTVLNEEPATGEGKSKRRWFKCACDCGKETVVRYDCLRRKKAPTESCGCIAREATTKRNTTHGMCGTPEYQLWVNIKKRCYVPTHANYEYYGGRGIQVCDKWRESFAAFFSDVGIRPSPVHSLDRISTDGHYEPGNVRWATALEQAANKRSNRNVEYRGEVKNLRQWSLSIGFDTGKFRTLTRKGISDQEALAILISRYQGLTK